MKRSGRSTLLVTKSEMRGYLPAYFDFAQRRSRGQTLQTVEGVAVCSALLRLCFGGFRTHHDGLEDFAAFLDHIEMVRSEGGTFIGCTGGPANLDVGFSGVVQAEVDAEVVL